MNASTFVLLSGALTYGVPLMLGVRELLILKRGGDDRDGGEPRQAAPRPPIPGTPASPLPACLIPNLPAKTPARELEPA
jgi:hypothetical protein